MYKQQRDTACRQSCDSRSGSDREHCAGIRPRLCQASAVRNDALLGRRAAARFPRGDLSPDGADARVRQGATAVSEMHRRRVHREHARVRRLRARASGRRADTAVALPTQLDAEVRVTFKVRVTCINLWLFFLASEESVFESKIKL